MFERFENILLVRGLRSPLVRLAQCTDCPSANFYCVDEAESFAAVYFHKLNPSIYRVISAPVNAAFRCCVRESLGKFKTVDSLVDPRLDDHQEREALRSYRGVPTLDREGALLRTLRHYDTIPPDPEQLDWPVLIKIPSAVARHFVSHGP